jgi:PBSX family phage terminase large subunit
VLEVPDLKSAISITDATARLNIWEGSVRSSKSVSADIAWLIFVATCPPGPLLITGKTRDTVHRNIIDPIAEWMPEEDFKPHQNNVEIFGRNVYIVGANDEKAIKKIQGLTLVGALGDEIATWPESYFKMLLSRLSLEGARFLGTTNPDGPFHWLKVDYLDALKPPHLHQWHFTLEDNPYLPKSFVKSLEAEYKPGTLWHKRYILGLWCAAEGAVYDMWDDKKQVVDTFEPADSHSIAIDYGTNNPCVFLLIGTTKDKIVVEKEYYYNSIEKGHQKTDGEYSKDLKEFIGNIPIKVMILDPSAASFKAQLRRDFPNIPIRDADNSVLDGIRLVSSLLQSERLKVHKSCTNLIKEFSSYIWDVKSQTKGEDVPVKKFDHALDALRYHCMTLMSKAGSPRVLRRFI